MTSPLAAGSLPLAAPHIGVEGEVPRPRELDEKQVDGIPFSHVLGNAVASANQKAIEAGAMSEAFANGTRDDIHGTMVAVKEAEIELKLVANVRNKLVEAFNDLWRMNI